MDTFCGPKEEQEPWLTSNCIMV